MFELFWIFFKLGLFTFGGGYAMIPQIKEIIVDKKRWITDDEMLEIIAVAESTPGPIAINLATYIGYKQKKILGSIISTLAVVLPSLITIFTISLFLDSFMNNQYVKHAFIGIKCCVSFLIIKAGINMLNKEKKSLFNILIFSLVFILMILFDLFSIQFSSILLIIIGGIIGVIYFSIQKLIKENKL